MAADERSRHLVAAAKALKNDRSTFEDHWQDIADVFAEFNHACAYCLRTDRKLTVDHMEPVSKGGGNTRSNIVPACLSCNSSKSDKSIFWMLNRAAA